MKRSFVREVALGPDAIRDILFAVDLERHRRRSEPGTDIDLPQLVQGGVVEGCGASMVAASRALRMKPVRFFMVSLPVSIILPS